MNTVKGFPNWPIGIPIDARRTPNDVIWTEVWGDGKFNSINTYCDDGNTVSKDGCWGHWFYSISV